VAVDSDSVYWANPNGGTVNQSGLDGSNPHALFADQFAPYGWPSARSEQGRGWRVRRPCQAPRSVPAAASPS